MIPLHRKLNCWPHQSIQKSLTTQNGQNGSTGFLATLYEEEIKIRIWKTTLQIDFFSLNISSS